MVAVTSSGFSFCALQYIPRFWPDIVDALQITLGAGMCLLVTFQFIKQSVQMYMVTKQFQLGRYMNLLVREGLVYFVAYVHVPFFLPLPLSCQLTMICYEQYPGLFIRHFDGGWTKKSNERRADHSCWGDEGHTRVHPCPPVYLELAATVCARCSEQTWSRHRHGIWSDVGVYLW